MSDDFNEAIKGVIEGMGLEMPKRLDNADHHKKYVAYLERKGLTEDSVGLMIDKERVKPEAHAALFAAFLSALKSDDKKQLAVIVDLMQTLMQGNNTNHLISRLAFKLVEDFAAAGVAIPEFYAGVYPTDCINAQCVVEQGLPLVLLDTGCFEMVEASIGTFVSKRNETEQAELMIRFLEDYFVKGEIPNPEHADHSSIDWGSGVVPILITAVEEFVIAHELAHIQLGHIEDGEKYALPTTKGDNVEIQRRDHTQEYEADLWAFIALIDRAKKLNNETAMDLACSGPLMFLGIGLMIEALAESRGLALRDSHPPVEDRLYLLELTLEVFKLTEYGRIARKFRRIVKEFCVLVDVAEKTPPMLSRELNRIAIQVYDSLGVEYAHAKFVTDFT